MYFELFLNKFAGGMLLAHLEYRLDNAAEKYPAIYHYRNIPLDELTLRLLCDFYVKQNTVYEHTWSAVEDEVYVIYVTPSRQENLAATLTDAQSIGFVLLEVRQLAEDEEEYPLLETIEFPTIQQLTPYILAGYRTIQNKVWETSSLEVDEDRRTYVLYVKESKTEEGSALQ